MRTHDKIVWYVFSAYAEVVLTVVRCCVSVVSILRVRGGSSVCGGTVHLMVLYSPRTRR